MLDSNVVLDWLVFDDASARPVAEAVVSRQVRWIATAAMRSELERVLTRFEMSAWKASPQDVMVQWHHWVDLVDAPAPTRVGALRCTDPDDQKFIDLALHAGATALLSRDRAVLKLAGRARGLGLTIQTAAAWTIGR